MPPSFPLKYSCARTQLHFIHKLYLNCLKPHPSSALHSPTEPEPSHYSSYSEVTPKAQVGIWRETDPKAAETTQSLLQAHNPAQEPHSSRQGSTHLPWGLLRFNPQQAPSGGTAASEPPTSKGLQVKRFKTSQEKPQFRANIPTLPPFE